MQGHTPPDDQGAELFYLGFTTPTCDVVGVCLAHWFYHAPPPAATLHAVTHTCGCSNFHLPHPVSAPSKATPHKLERTSGSGTQ